VPDDDPPLVVFSTPDDDPPLVVFSVPSGVF
jgi:hypothetical protein